MIGRGLLALAAERLDVTPWPVEVLEAVRVVVDEVDHASGCSMCHSGMQVDEVNLMLAAFTSGDTGAGMDDLASACTDLAGELRQHEPRCGARWS